MNRGKSRFSIAIIAFCLLAAGCSNAAPAPVPAVAPTQADVESFDGVQIETKSWEEADGYIKVSYPQLTGLNDPSKQAQINADLERIGKPSEQLRQEVKANLGGSPEQPESHEGYQSQYEVKFRNGPILNLVFDSYTYTGGAHGMPNRISYIVDLRTGQRCSVQDLFAPGSGFLYRLSQLVKEQDVSHVLNALGTFEGVELYDGFVLNDKGLTVYFAPYEHTPYAVGFPEFSLAAADFIDLIDPDSPFAKLWGDLQPTRAKEDQETLVRDLVSRYERAIVTAVSTKDFEAVAPYLKPGSPLYQSQQDLVKKLGDQGIYEQLVSSSTDHIEGDKVYATDTVTISQPDAADRTETFRWAYTFDPATLTLTDLAAWN